MSDSTMKKPSAVQPIGGIIAGVAICVLIAWVASLTGGARVAGLPVLVWCAILAMGVQWVVFIHAWTQETEHFFDLTGSLTFLTVTWFAVIASDAFDARSLVLAIAVSVWAVRLGTFLFRRVRAVGEDRRFRSLKTSFPKFLMTWTMQGSWVFVTACCALAAISSLESKPLGGTFYLGAAMWLVGFVVEVVADTQKSRFKADPNNANRFIREGLWAWSRHPNYFGEILLWAGIAVMAAPVLSGWQLVTLISPIFVIFQLTIISGVPLLERRAQKQWGDDPEYQAYRASTPALVPWPPAQ